LKIKINDDERLTINIPDEIDWITFIGLVEKLNKYAKVLGKDNSSDFYSINKLIQKSKGSNSNSNSEEEEEVKGKYIKSGKYSKKNGYVSKIRTNNSKLSSLWSILKDPNKRYIIINLYAAKYLRDRGLFLKVVKYYNLQDLVINIDYLGNIKWLQVKKDINLLPQEVGLAKNFPSKKTGAYAPRIPNFTTPLLEKLKKLKLKDVEGIKENKGEIKEIEEIEEEEPKSEVKNVIKKDLPDATSIINNLRKNRKLLVQLFDYYYNKTDQEFIELCEQQKLIQIIPDKLKFKNVFGWLKMYHRITPLEINLNLTGGNNVTTNI
jgi:hypothetical protein